MSPAPFFAIEWQALNNPQLLPDPADTIIDSFFTVAWQPTLGLVHYPYAPAEVEVVTGLRMPVVRP
jgi:hypothetical protein